MGTVQLMAPVGAGLYVDSGRSDSLGLSGAAAHMHGFADQGQSSSAAQASQFDHVMLPSYSGSSMFRSHQASDLSFFLGGGAPATNNQDLSEDGGDHSEGIQGPQLLHGKAPPFHAHLMHLPAEQQYHQPSSSNANNVNLLDFGFFSGNSGGASGSHGPLLHGKEPFHGHDLMMQLPEQQYQQPGSSNANANANLPNLGFFSGNNSGGWSGSGTGSGQDARLVIQDQFNGGAGGSNTEHGNVMASIGSHFGGGFSSSLYNSSSPSPSAGLSATALLMKAAQMGSTTSSTPRNGPSALLHAAGFAGTASGQGNSMAAAEEEASHEAHFHDLIMNSLPLMGGGEGGFPGTAGMAGVDDGNLSTRDFLGVGRDDATMAAPTAGLHMGAALDPSQMKWFI